MLLWRSGEGTMSTPGLFLDSRNVSCTNSTKQNRQQQQRRPFFLRGGNSSWPPQSSSASQSQSRDRPRSYAASKNGLSGSKSLGNDTGAGKNMPRLSSRTGGFEGSNLINTSQLSPDDTFGSGGAVALPSCDDDITVQMANIMASHEFPSLALATVTSEESPSPSRCSHLPLLSKSHPQPPTSPPRQFRLPDEAERGKVPRRHSDSPVTFDRTENAVVHPTSAQRRPRRRRHSTNSSPACSEQGFEVSISGSVVREETRCDLDDDASASTGWKEESCTDAGAVRLTEEGLKRHEHKALQQSRLEKYSFSSSVVSAPVRLSPSSKLAHEQHPRNRATTSISKQKSRSTISASSNSKRIRPKPFGGILAKKGPVEDVEDFSLAPLNAMEHLHLQTTAAAKPRVMRRSNSDPGVSGEGGGCSKKVLGGIVNKIFRKKESPAAALLERERRAAAEAKRKQEYKEHQEHDRIERKRRAYLKAQRMRERDQPLLMSPAQRDSVFVSLELVEEDQRNRSPTKKKTANHTHSTASSSAPAGPVVPVCAVCKEGERTHIATPCMHLAFCEDCAKRLRREHKACTICSRNDVEFHAVSF